MTRAAALLPRLLLGLILLGAAIWLALNRDRLDPTLIENAVRDLGLLAPLGHILLFALATILFAPGVIFGLAGGALFGPLLGTMLNQAGATLGATAAFLIARYLAADWARSKAGPRLDRLVTGVEAEGWRFVAFVRLVPLFPFNLTNYALGLTRIPLTHYVLASFVCMVPGTIAYTWLGYAGREALAGNETAIRYGLLALALLAAVAFLPRLVRRLRGRTTIAANDRRSGALWLPQAATALAVLSCYGTLALVTLLSLIGVSLAIDDRIWAGSIGLFAALATLAIVISYRRHSTLGPIVVAVFGLALILWVMLGTYDRLIEGAGFALLIAATVWDWRASARRAAAADAVAWIEVGELAAKVNAEGAAVIDVRGHDEFTGNLGLIANALNLPVDELPNRLTEINALKERPIILVCRTDKRSAIASTLLRDAGFQNIRVLRGSMVEWNRSGLPVKDRDAGKDALAREREPLNVGANP